MESFAGKIAVVTGGGSGMGRELVRQLSAEGATVATCDVSGEALAETAASSAGRVVTFVADVSVEPEMAAFRDFVVTEVPTGHVNLLFNNAGIGGGGSFVTDDRGEWEKTFAVCWYGVYHGCRAFMPLLLAASEGHVVNTSSVNGFWASLGPSIPHTAYSAAKFAVKGFTEALMNDFRVNAPHLRASVVMPGHIGTSIAINSARILGRDPKELTAEQLAQVRDRLERMGLPTEGASDEDIRTGLIQQGETFRDSAPLTAAQAAAIILDGVRRGEWRILVGDDAHLLDRMVRETPVEAYEPSFMARLNARGALRVFER